jgi:hypothetical protein
MSFIHLRTIDGKELWLNLERVTAFSYSDDEHICLIEISGGEPHQISKEEFEKLKPYLNTHSPKVRTNPKIKKKGGRYVGRKSSFESN